MNKLKNETWKLHQQLQDLINTIRGKERYMNYRWGEVKYIRNWIQWLSPKTLSKNYQRVNEMNDAIASKCKYDELMTQI